MCSPTQWVIYIHHNYSSHSVNHTRCITSGMLSIVGTRESAHAKLEARTALQYVQCGLHIYIERENRLFSSLGGLATHANCVLTLGISLSSS